MAGVVRQPIDEKAFEKFVSENVPVIKTPIELKQFGFEAPGKLLSKTAHQVEREYRVLHALGPTDVAVPKTYCLCEDDSVIGTPFYIMEFLDGRIFEDFLMPGISPEERTALWKEAVQTLARFHAVDPHKVGLEKFGKAGGYFNRQIKTWGTIQAAQAKAVDIETKVPVGPLPHIEEILRFFGNEKQQPKDRVTLVHGDYKIDNLVFHKTEPRVIGILDWEMSTIGHPLSDVNNFLMQFAMCVQPDAGPTNTLAFQPGKTPGLPQVEQILEWYTEVSGYDPRPEMPWGSAFAIFRLAVVLQGIAARYAARQASSANAKLYSQKRNSLGELAWVLAQEANQKTTPRL
ncbi:putative acyl-CoA dehydrogenase IBR3 [Cladobotryum mycophilum]|uniref:Acyl-CoA dehydrogenase IBR3 n=1 Tax=Cladobotryum mycophilum TaxID=491253 RepID=A0ABR0SE70_9HYPO